MRKIEGGYLMQSNFSEELNSPQINAEQKSGVNIAWQIASLLSPGSAGIFVKNQLTFISQGQINGDQAINQVLAQANKDDLSLLFVNDVVKDKAFLKECIAKKIRFIICPQLELSNSEKAELDKAQIVLLTPSYPSFNI